MALPATKACRHRLHTILEPLLVAPAGPAEAVVRFRTADLDQKSPLVVITTARATLTKEVKGSFWASRAFLIVCLARYEDQASEETAEDALDQMDDIIIEALGGSANQVNELWQALDLMQDERDSISLGGADYRQSLFVVRLEVYNR
jgi:hypothetical protein